MKKLLIVLGSIGAAIAAAFGLTELYYKKLRKYTEADMSRFRNYY